MSSVALYNANDPYEVLISQMIAIERQPQDLLKTQRKDQERLKNVMKDVDSRISALHKVAKELKDTFNSPFRGRTASAPSGAPFTVSAGDAAAFGAHTLQVDRLASADTRLSRQYAANGNALAAYADTTQSFSIELYKPGAEGADENGLVSISVTADLTGKTNDADILSAVRSAINTAMEDAVTAGTITDSDKAVASVVRETSDTARLTLRSGETGYENRLRFTDSAGGLLAALEVTNESTRATPEGGGAVAAVGTGEMDSELNSKFTLDGLTLYRSSNAVSDAVDGLTIDLKKTDADPYEFSVATDGAGIKNKLNDFIKKYNDLLGYIAGKSAVDGDTGVRGDFAADSTFRDLRYSLRNDLSRQVGGQATGSPSMLADIGIEIGKDGTLSIKDEKKLLAAVEKDAGAVERLFSADGATSDADGLAVRLTDRLERFVGAGGVVSSRSKAIDERLRRFDTRIKAWDERLSQKETQLRMQFAKMQETISILQGQGQSLSGILGYY